MQSISMKASGMLRLFRIELPTAAGLCVVLGQLLVLGRLPALADAGLGFAVGFFLSASALIFNDIFDLEVDRINAPHRPLPSGRVSPVEAAALGSASALAGLAASWLFSPFLLVLSLLTWVLGFFYNWKLKAAGIWGNLSVSLSVGMTFLIGGISVGEPFHPAAWTFALLVFVFDLAEEIAADAMDVEGDRKRGARSIAILYGRPFALRLAGLLLGLVVLISWVPFLLGERSLPYLLAIAVIDAAILVFGVQLVRSRDVPSGRKWIRALYLGASLGLVVFLAGQFIFR
jgi:geranylgeranylglycerol-phosphate geranylgeranyltransferase